MTDATPAQFDPTPHVRKLWDGCENYWRREAGVVSRYLREGRSRQADVAWLRLAAYKETRLYRELSSSARADYEAGRLRGEGWRILAEEMRHYRLICELIVELDGTPPAPDEVIEFRADRILQQARGSLRSSREPLDRCLSALVEGGGGAMYEVLSRLDVTPFDRRLAAVFASILDDEMDHGPGHLRYLAPLLHGQADVDRARGVLDKLGRLRVAMREEMFAKTMRE